MNKLIFLLSVAISAFLLSCTGKDPQAGNAESSIEENISFVDNQYGLMLTMLEDQAKF